MSIDLKVEVPFTADSAAKAFGANLLGVDEPAVLGTTAPTAVDTAHIAWPFSEDTCDCIHVVLVMS